MGPKKGWIKQNKKIHTLYNRHISFHSVDSQYLGKSKSKSCIQSAFKSQTIKIKSVPKVKRLPSVKRTWDGGHLHYFGQNQSASHLNQSGLLLPSQCIGSETADWTSVVD